MMKKTFVWLCIVACVAISTAFAQKTPKEPEVRATKLTNSLEKNLTLSSEQKDKIYAINLEIAKKKDQLRADRKAASPQDKGKFKGQGKTIAQERERRIQELLNTDQKAKFEQMKAEVKKRKMEKRAKQKAKGKGKGKGKGKNNQGDDDMEEDDDDLEEDDDN
jgi:hypothetical protein